jgi:2-oxoglutarate ferredoxin oxidoreductase subunit alpha
VKDIVIRFAGDSGDGIQLAGRRFTETAALFGNDLSTLPDFPAEIRAPAGTLAGVSGFQIRIAGRDIHTPGDVADVLVAMNPAALRANAADLRPGGVLLVNVDAFGARDLQRAGYSVNPLESGAVDGFHVIPVELTRLNRAALRESSLTTRQIDRCRNFFALGIMFRLFGRDPEPTRGWLRRAFDSRPDLRDANVLSLDAGVAYVDATELFHVPFDVPPTQLAPGTYRNINGNRALALGFAAASRQSGLPLFVAGYPITPASEVLHETGPLGEHGVITYQAEDEIAAAGAALGAAYGGHLAVTVTSGPGLDLKSETLGLAITAELPMVIVDVQRAGPSTGLPTKTEQSDLLHACFGRHGEAPLPVLAAATPGDCFWIALEAARIALKYVTPVIVLSDSTLATGAEPWRIPRSEDLPEFRVAFETNPDGFAPYRRDPETLARNWAIPGTPGLEHRIGGLEKEETTGAVSYDPENHEVMTRLRIERIERIAREIPALHVYGDVDADLLIVSWGSTRGAVLDAVGEARQAGIRVGAIHLRYIHPFPSDLGDHLRRARRVLVPEVNAGQLVRLLRDRYLVDAISHTRIQGKPLRVSELVDAIAAHADENSIPEGGA